LSGEDGPVRMVREVWATEPDDWQEKGLRAYGRGERRISIVSCHGVGKTAYLSWCIVHSILCRFPQDTVATAPTAAQLNDVLFKEVVIWIKRLPQPLQACLEIKSDRIELVASPKESYFAARTARAEKPEALAGIHNDAGFVLIIADEASGVPDPIFETAVGSMSGKNCTTILTGNPVRTSGLFFDTHHSLKDMWFTLHVSYEMSSRVDRDMVEQVRRTYGEESNAFRVRCLGLFPKADDDTVIPFELVELARTRDIVVPPFMPTVWGLDVARFGSDKTAIVKRNALRVNSVQIWSKLSTMEVIGRVKAQYDEVKSTPECPNTILVDVIGVGAGVVDRGRELGMPVRGINVSESPSSVEKYLNLRAELWFKGLEWLQGRNVSIPAAKDHEDPIEIMCRELVVPKYEFSSNGKIKVESKEDMKKREPRIGSPNAADAFLLTFAEELQTMSHGSQQSVRWNQPLKRGLKGIV
jgi:phage terminase large subunit